MSNGFNLHFFFRIACAVFDVHGLRRLVVNLQLALHTIRSHVSVLTRNKPWVTGEGQLTPKNFALPFIKVFGKLKVSDLL